MPKYKVKVIRLREETATAYVTADNPNDIFIDEAEVQYNEWIPDPYETTGFEIDHIEEVK